MKITVITVSFNEEKNIAKTIESVLNQTSSDFEYIICDGKSSDKTVEIATGYIDKFAEKGIKYIINSEKDKGIYDGMNKGIDLANGDYVYFLNAGDWFCSNDVLDKVISGAEKAGHPDVVYGNVVGVDRSVTTVVESDDTMLTESMTVCHQSLFASAIKMKERKFDLRYRIAADYNFLLGLKLDGGVFSNLGFNIAYYSYDGVSTVNVDRCYNEQADVREAHGFDVDREMVKKLIKKEKRAQKIKSLMPKRMWVLWSVKIKKKQVLSHDH
jgi:glycosyltransferase involved in cell wall biosynthesis